MLLCLVSECEIESSFQLSTVFFLLHRVEKVAQAEFCYNLAESGEYAQAELANAIAMIWIIWKKILKRLVFVIKFDMTEAIWFSKQVIFYCPTFIETPCRCCYPMTWWVLHQTVQESYPKHSQMSRSVPCLVFKVTLIMVQMCCCISRSFGVEI